MGLLTPITVRCSAIGRLAAFVLVMLILSPFTAPFSVMSGELQASPSGPADGVQYETTHTPVVVEVVFVHCEPSSSFISFQPVATTALAEFTHINRVLRL